MIIILFRWINNVYTDKMLLPINYTSLWHFNEACKLLYFVLAKEVWFLISFNFKLLFNTYLLLDGLFSDTFYASYVYCLPGICLNNL